MVERYRSAPLLFWSDINASALIGLDLCTYLDVRLSIAVLKASPEKAQISHCFLWIHASVDLADSLTICRMSGHLNPCYTGFQQSYPQASVDSGKTTPSSAARSGLIVRTP